MALDLERPRKKKRHESCLADTPQCASATALLSTPQHADSLQQKVLRSFAERDEALRAITTCKICFRPLYEPFTNQCGHTYCYSCLCQWFTNVARSQKTCPDCRMILTRAPAPAYALREVTRELLQRPELLSGDDLAGHKQLQREEAAAVDQDRSNHDPSTGGLFKGCFTQSSREPRLAPLWDLEDGVVRCPACAWELEGRHPYCHNCGYDFDSDQDSDGAEERDELSEAIGTEDELDGDMSLEDHDFDGSMHPYADEDSYSLSSRSGSSTELSISVFLPPDIPPLRGEDNSHHLNVVSGPSSGISYQERFHYLDHSSNEADTDEEYSASMDEFVVDDDASGEHATPSEKSNSITREVRSHAASRRLRYTIIDSDDEDENSPPPKDEASDEVTGGTATTLQSSSSYDVSRSSSSPTSSSIVGGSEQNSTG